VSFQETLNWIPHRYTQKVRVSGIPLRSELFSQSKDKAYEHFGLDPALPTLLVFGGSLGAEGLNRRFAAAVSGLSGHWNIIHIVGKGKSFPVEGNSRYRQFEFLGREMSLAYSIADVALCRAGASSIFELAAARIPMILVPLGLHQSRGDQIINAKIFAERGWAVWCDEEQLTPERILELVNEQRVRGHECRVRLESAPGAATAAKVAQVILSLMKRESIAEPF
jgi:UDP-N-acetylglucosamine--N-acetylmuramyl-(pentapeptide) pyrophosphoryl-undecaprenol N-acetylglucosamine transferase